MNKLTNVTETDRGMTGIGVLILFIALVLVAAIASGLILDTAGMLQNTAQNTGEQSTSEVSDRLSVLSASGDVQATDDIATASTGSVSGSAGSASTSMTYDPPEQQTVTFVELNDFTTDTEEDLTVDLMENGTSVETVTLSSSELEVGSAADYRLDFNTTINSGNTYEVQVTSTNATFSGDVALQVVDGQSNRVTELGMTVYKSPGADDVDLQHATVEYFSPDGTAFLIHETEFNAVNNYEDFSENLGYFNTEAVKDEDSSIPVLNSRDDRASMIIGLYERPDGHATGEPAAMDHLDAGESATLRITTQSGATTTQIVNVPESLAGYDGSTVML